MGYYELLEESFGLFLLALIIDLSITLLVYGAFPVLYARKCVTPILTKKYKRKCFGINALGIVFFFLLSGAASAAPYMLWTWVFSNYGLKKLTERGLLLDAPIVDEPTEEQVEERKFFKTSDKRFCRKCGAELLEGTRFCRKCGTEIIEEKDL